MLRRCYCDSRVAGERCEWLDRRARLAGLLLGSFVLQMVTWLHERLLAACRVDSRVGYSCLYF